MNVTFEFVQEDEFVQNLDEFEINYQIGRMIVLFLVDRNYDLVRSIIDRYPECDTELSMWSCLHMGLQEQAMFLKGYYSREGWCNCMMEGSVGKAARDGDCIYMKLWILSEMSCKVFWRWHSSVATPILNQWKSLVEPKQKWFMRNVAQHLKRRVE